MYNYFPLSGLNFILSYSIQNTKMNDGFQTYSPGECWCTCRLAENVVPSKGQRPIDQSHLASLVSAWGILTAQEITNRVLPLSAIIDNNRQMYIVDGQHRLESYRHFCGQGKH